MTQPWGNEEATRCIRKIAKHDNLDITYTGHALKRLRERDIILSDVLYGLKNGCVKRDCEKATREGFYKYRVESKTPNSEGQTLCVIVIPDETKPFIKIVTLFWKNEKQALTGKADEKNDE